MMQKDRERRLGDDIIPEKEIISMETDDLGRKYEARETVYKGQKVQ